MKKLILFAVAAMAAGVSFATTAGTDNASQAVYHDGDGWADGDDGSASGDAFGAWSFEYLSGPATNVIGGQNANGVDVGANGFGLTAEGPEFNGGHVDALRLFNGAMNVGDVFSFTLGLNLGSSYGDKTFYLYSGGGFAQQEFLINHGDWDNNNGDTPVITYWGYGAVGGNMFNNYGTDAMNINLAYLAGNQLRVTANGRDGVESFDQTFSISAAPTGFKFNAHDLPVGVDHQLFFNNLEIANAPVPEPATMGLLGLGALALALRRKMTK